MKEYFFIVVGIFDKVVIIFKGCDEFMIFFLNISDDYFYRRSKTRIGSFYFIDGKFYL